VVLIEKDTIIITATVGKVVVISIGNVQGATDTVAVAATTGMISCYHLVTTRNGMTMMAG